MPQSIRPTITENRVTKDEKIGVPTQVTSLHDIIAHDWSSGYFYGGALTDNGNGTVNIAAGEAMLRPTANENADLYSCVVPAATNLSLTDGSMNYIYVDYNSGSPQILVTTNILDFNCMDKCHLYSVHREGTRLYVIEGRSQNVDHNRRLRRRLYETEGLVLIKGGSILTVNGSQQISVTSGKIYSALRSITHGTFNTALAGNGADRTTTHYFRNGSGGWSTTPNAKQIDGTRWDDGDGGLATFTTSYYGWQWVYLMVSETPTLATLYGTGQYPSQEDAARAPLPSQVPPAISSVGILLGKVVTQDGSSATTVYLSGENTFTVGGLLPHAATHAVGGSDVVDHGTLYGLGDDDHTQYHNDTRGDARYEAKNSNIQSHISNTSNPHTTTAAQVSAVDKRGWDINRRNGALSWSDATHILNNLKSGTYSDGYYKDSVYYASNTDQSVDLDNEVTLTANTLYYVYANGIGPSLQASASVWDLRTVVPVATVFWNGSAGAVIDERHGMNRNIDWHHNAHFTIGARYGSGFDLTAPTTANDANLNIGNGVMWDEDIQHTLVGQTDCRLWYKVSASVYTFVNSTTPYPNNAGAVQYLRTSDYTLQNAGNSNFVNMWVYAVPDISRHFYIIPTHAAAAHNTIALARAEAPPILSGMNVSSEMKLIYRFIYKGDGQFQEADDYRMSSSLPYGSVAPAVDAAQISYTPSGLLTATDLQAAVDQLEAAKSPLTHNHQASEITSGTLDGDRLPAISTTKAGAVPATGTPTGKLLKDDGTWATFSGTGDVVGPSSAVDGNIATFNGTGGKTIKDSGMAIADHVMTGKALMISASNLFV